MIEVGKEYKNVNEIINVFNLDPLGNAKGGYQRQLRVNQANRILSECGLILVKIKGSQRYEVKEIA